MSQIDPDDELAAREADRAAAAAAAIGGEVTSEPQPAADALTEAERPLTEAGQGEAEGFEQAEEELIERASHGDQHAARRAIEDAPDEPDDPRSVAGAEADEEYSSERGDGR